MGFITHIPGTKPLVPQARHPRSKGLGVLGLHEGRTLLLALGRASRVHAVAGCDLSEEKIQPRWAAAIPPRGQIVAIYTPIRYGASPRPQAGKNSGRW